MKNIIGFWGCPKKEIINDLKKKYPYAKWVDLDIDYNYPDLKYLPNAYCTIIKNIYNNAIHLKDELITILAPIGKDKCDSAYFIAQMLLEKGYDIILTLNEEKSPDTKNLNIPISQSSLPLKQKIELITSNIIEQKDYSNLKKIEPKFGFWGVPPNELSLLDIFPNETEVFGWTRAVEAGYPGDWEIETYVKRNLPTVFFTQAFCSKTVIAKSLANKYEGLFIDVDTTPTNSIIAKIEAFIKLR